MRFVRVWWAGLGGAAVLFAAAGSGAAPDGGAPDAASPDAAGAGNSDAEHWERVRAEVKRHARELDRCYDRALARDPCARGSLTVRFDVQPDGRVSGVRADEAPWALADLSACVTQAVGTWRMPAPAGVGYARVRYPFTFTPTTPAAPEQSCGARILDQAAYGRRQLPPAVDRGQWWAVCDRGNDFDVRPVRLSVKPFRDEMSEDGPREKTGREIAAGGCAHPAFLVQGVYGASSGPMPKARFETRGDWPVHAAEIALDAVTYQLRYEGGQEGPWRIVLAGLGAPATILSWSSFPPSGWSIRWAGDLDGDRHPDFVIEEITETGATILHLFVSRAAPRGADVRELAQTSHGGC